MLRSAATPLSPRTAHLFVWLEKYAVPPVYGLLIYQRIRMMEALPTQYRKILASGHAPAHAAEIYTASMVKHGLLLTLMGFVALALLLNRPPRALPDKLGQVLIPLVASFYFVLYAALDQLPGWLSVNLFPEEWQPVLALAGVLCSGLGYAICLWSLVYLRTSFALWVSVRDVVTGGPYRYVRHPIYLGYFLDQAGLLLASGAVGFLLLSVVYMMFQVHRARMEEEKLAQSSREYRLYRQRSGFLLPRWR